MEPRRLIQEAIAADIQLIEHLIETISQNAIPILPHRLNAEIIQVVKSKNIHCLRSILDNLKALNESSRINPPALYTSLNDGVQFYTPSKKYLGNDPFPNASHIVFCKKKSRKINGSPHSELELTHDDGTRLLNLRLEHIERTTMKPQLPKGEKDWFDKRYPGGGFSKKVKKGFERNDLKPTHAIKQFINLEPKHRINMLRMAMRSAYFSRVLGRTGLAFEWQATLYMVSDWYDGKELSKYKKRELSAISINKRVRYALDITRQIAILHNSGLIHQDIKPDNIIISESAAHLIDLDGIRLIDEPRSVKAGRTQAFIEDDIFITAIQAGREHEQYHFNIKSDTYALGLTLVWLFPEILSREFRNRPIIVGTRKANKGFVHLEPGNAARHHHELCEFLLRFICSNPKDRIQSAIEAHEKLLIIAENKYQIARDGLSDLPPIADKETINNALFQIQVESYEHPARIARYNQRLPLERHDHSRPKTNKQNRPVSALLASFEWMDIPEQESDTSIVHEQLSKLLETIKSNVLARPKQKDKHTTLVDCLASTITKLNGNQANLAASLKSVIDCFHLAMQHHQPCFSNTTETGELIRHLINQPEHAEAKAALFPYHFGRITYPHMRFLVCGKNDASFFSSRKMNDTLKKLSKNEVTDSSPENQHSM